MQPLPVIKEEQSRLEIDPKEGCYVLVVGQSGGETHDTGRGVACGKGGGVRVDWQQRLLLVALIARVRCYRKTCCARQHPLVFVYYEYQ